MTPTETFIILKYGSISKAYTAWMNMGYSESKNEFSDDDRDILRNYELEMHEATGLGYGDPR